MPSRLDLGQIQNIVDQRKEVFPTAFDDRDLTPLIRSKVSIPLQNLGIAENGVKRGAQFMTHIRKKAALGLIGRLRGFLRMLQQLLAALTRQCIGHDMTKHA